MTLLAEIGTSEALREVSAALKAQAIALLEAHFAQHPTPISNLEEVDNQPIALNLLDYPVDIRKFEAVSVVELSEQGFIYEPDYGERGWESYGVLSLEALLDLLEVVEKSVLCPAFDALDLDTQMQWVERVRQTYSETRVGSKEAFQLAGDEYRTLGGKLPTSSH